LLLRWGCPRSGTAEQPKAFGVFYDRVEGQVLAFLVRATRRADVAAELAAEAFAAALAAAAA
jgi:RNA polymerase sigma-70 factor (ECF subfamily)